MKRQFNAQRLDVVAFAEDGATVSGTAELRGFPRLAAEAGGRGGERPVTWTASGEQLDPSHVQPQVWLHLRASATLALVCQRCLEPVDVALQVERSFRFVADEETAAAEDDEAEEDLLAMDQAFDLVELVEDELLMALPAVPRHEACPVPVKLTAADPDFQEAAPVHPFARLKDLKTGGG